MKANLDDCMLIKKYHRELTDNAIRLIRKAHKIFGKIIQRYLELAR
jgi:nicotinate-nucleotide pyrophosphorylase